MGWFNSDIQLKMQFVDKQTHPLPNKEEVLGSFFELFPIGPMGKMSGKLLMVDHERKFLETS